MAFQETPEMADWIKRELADVRPELENQRSESATEHQFLGGLRAQGYGPLQLQHFERALAARDAFISAREEYERALADWLDANDP